MHWTLIVLIAYATTVAFSWGLHMWTFWKEVVPRATKEVLKKKNWPLDMFIVSLPPILNIIGAISIRKHTMILVRKEKEMRQWLEILDALANHLKNTHGMDNLSRQESLDRDSGPSTP
jgi:hypothetical protein